MKKNIVILLSILFSISLFSQQNKNFDIIIFVDEEIVIEGIADIKFILKDTSNLNNNIIIEADYYPGNLSITKSDYERILLSNKDLFLKFTYYGENEKGKRSVYLYEIEYQKSWMNTYFNILKIYNFDNSKYRRAFTQTNKEQKYTFEIISPDYSLIRIRKK